MEVTELELGERIVFRSKRGGISAHSSWMWLLFIFGGLQVCGAITGLALLAGTGPSEGAASVSPLTAGMPRGPLFVGPTKVIGFAEALLLPRQQQVLTIAGAERPAADIEQSVLELTRSAELGRGRAVVMDRDGVTLAVEGPRFMLTSGANVVAFELDPDDAKRAERFVKAIPGHPYRG